MELESSHKNLLFSQVFKKAPLSPTQTTRLLPSCENTFFLSVRLFELLTEAALQAYEQAVGPANDDSTVWLHAEFIHLWVLISVKKNHNQTKKIKTQTCSKETKTIWQIVLAKVGFSSSLGCCFFCCFFFARARGVSVSCCLLQSGAEPHYWSMKPVTRQCERLVSSLIISEELPGKSGCEGVDGGAERPSALVGR